MKYKNIGFAVSLAMPWLIILLASGVDTLAYFILALIPFTDPEYPYAAYYYSGRELVTSAFRQGLMFVVICLVPAGLGRLAARRLTLPENCFPRYLPLILPGLLWVIISIPFMRLTGWPLEYLAVHGYFLLFLYFLFFLGFTTAARRRQPSRRIKKGLLQLAACTGLVLAAAGLNLWQLKSNTLFGFDPEIESVGHGVDVYEYFPFYEGNRLAVPDTPPSVQIRENHPRLDGAIALLPVYGAAAQALYADVETGDYWEYPDSGSSSSHIEYLVNCSNTPVAWALLVSGNIDIFFGAHPSREQLQMVRENGFEPLITPIAKDAFVFMVNEQNPVDNLSIEQIQAIYRKEINNWEDAGGEDEKILAFQRPEGSGSQTAMREQVMNGLKMADPLREELASGMGDIINAVAEFRNRREAIGYTFRWYARMQFPSERIKLLSVNGVSPSPENIASGAYPFSAPFVAVTLRPRSPQTQTLIDWLTGPEGQALIEKTGYIPLGAQAEPGNF